MKFGDWWLRKDEDYDRIYELGGVPEWSNGAVC